MNLPELIAELQALLAADIVDPHTDLRVEEAAPSDYDTAPLYGVTITDDGLIVLNP